MITEHFVATPELLRNFAAMHPDTPWVQAEAFMNALQANGFDAPKSEVDGLASDSKEAPEFTQVWRHNKKEGAMLYLAHGRAGTIAMASLTWTLGVGLTSSQVEETVKQTLANLSLTLGPVHAALDQTAAWVSEGGAGFVDEMAASACWSRDAGSGSRHIQDPKEYQTACRGLKNPIGFSVVLEKFSAKQWNVIGTLLA